MRSPVLFVFICDYLCLSVAKKYFVANFTPDTGNELFQLAIRLVNQGNRNIFLTGKAGTGKTTFLKFIRGNCPKQMAIVAPTGVAAINAGGVTIHSFFQLPLSPFIPESRGLGFSSAGQEVADKHSLLSRLRFNADKLKVLQQLELLIIDEISMVRCDTLDAIDTILRHVRQRPGERFGGVQMLFIGDLFQLPPVIKDEEWKLLSVYYKGPCFFDSLVLTEEPPLQVEFTRIYRQQDEQFIRVLNQVRDNQLDEAGLKILESRFHPAFRRTKQDGYIILTTHNAKAAEINHNELARLGSPLFRYEAEITDTFSDRAFPADEVLNLKEGAQVMFIRNDPAEKGKRFYNGRLGVVSRLEEERIFVQCDDGDNTAEIEVQKEKWENIRYTVNKSTRQLESEVLGSFTQYPLRLAWAITIHKSQGLTFEKAIIDAGEAFAPGQVYVALSRCTSLEGMVLQSRINTGSLSNDPRIVAFSQNRATDEALRAELARSAKQYQQGLIRSLFNYTPVQSALKELEDYIRENEKAFNPETREWTGSLSSLIRPLQDTADKFSNQLNTLFREDADIAGNGPLQERMKAAAAYFIPENEPVLAMIRQSPAITDSKLHAKEYHERVKDLFSALAEKQFLLEGTRTGFEPDAFLHHRAQFRVPSFALNAYAGANHQKTDSPHPVLLQQLRKLRDSICAKKDMPIYYVASSSTLEELARYLPGDLGEIRKISGFGEAKTEQYGQAFLDIILAYCEANGLSSLIHEKLAKRERKKTTAAATGGETGKKKKGETYLETLRLFREGKDLNTIAALRNLSISTIESHLTRLIESGDIAVDDLLSADLRALVEAALKEQEGQSITSIKQTLGDAVSFGQIRWVIAARRDSHSVNPD